MRHQYTPVFREFTTSSMWAETPATRCVWLYLLLHADPEGFVPGTVPGLAVAANVDLADTRFAIEKFMAPDPDSNSQTHEGRRLEKVPHGWRILNFEYWRELARSEAEKARKRRWINAKRRAENDIGVSPAEFFPALADALTVDTSTDVDASSEKLDAPKPKPKPKPDPSSSSSVPAAPEVEPVESRSLVLHELPADMVLPEHLADEARQAGVLDPHRWFDKLKEGPIGGERGVLARGLEGYLRRLFGSWRSWEETERAKDAQRSAAAASPRRFGDKPVLVDPFEPAPKHEAFARQHGLDLATLLKGVLTDHPQPLVAPASRLDVLGERLRIAAKQKQAGQPVTGRLTREQAVMWGAPPPGGAIPEVA